MNRRQKIVLLCLPLVLLTTGARSADELNSAALDHMSAYCELQRKEARLKADAAMRPAFYSEYTIRSVLDPSEELENMDTRYLRTGLELELHSVRRALKIQDLAEARCEHYQRFSSYSRQREKSDASIEEKALTAKLASLTDSVAILEKTLAVSKERLNSRSVTIQTVEDLSARLTQLRLRFVNTKGELAQAKDRLARIRGGSASDLSSIGDSERKAAILQTDLAARDFWELTLAGGTERIWRDQKDETNKSGKPYYVQLTFKYNLLGPFYLSRHSSYKRALTNWIVADPKNVSDIAAEDASRRVISIETAEDTLKILTDRKFSIEEVVDRLKTTVTTDFQSFLNRLFYELSETKAEIAYLETKIQLLKSSNTAPTVGSFAEDEKEKSVMALNPNIKTVKITSGTVNSLADGSFVVESPKLRARSLMSEGDAIEAEFFYQGNSSLRQPLAGGQDRDQFGVFINALNQCNLLYVMIRLSDSPTMVIQKKINRGMETHEECGNQGYETVASQNIDATLVADKTKPFVLAAKSIDNQVTVTVNGVELWKGTVPLAGLGQPGYSGVRSDNGHLKFKISK